jgi:hypothetical protein
MFLAFGFQGNDQGCHGKLLTTGIGSKDFNNAFLALFSPACPCNSQAKKSPAGKSGNTRGICKEKNACFSGEDRHSVKLYMQNAVKEMRR